MTRIILARHGETEWNVAEMFRGRADIDLSANGEKQIVLLAKHLSAVEVEAVYASPLKRALKTATAIADQHGLKVIISPGLNDMSFGEWEGRSTREVNEKAPDLFALWNSSPHRLRIPSGETMRQVRRRGMAVVKEVARRHQGTVVLVSHRAVIQVLICALLGLSNAHFWRTRIDLCGTSIFDYRDGQFILIRHNDISYL